MKRGRVPGTSSLPVLRREIACGVDPAAAMRRAVEDVPVSPGEVWDIAVRHDDGCPAIRSGPMSACTCELVHLEAKRLR